MGQKRKRRCPACGSSYKGLVCSCGRHAYDRSGMSNGLLSFSSNLVIQDEKPKKGRKARKQARKQR